MGRLAEEDPTGFYVALAVGGVEGLFAGEEPFLGWYEYACHEEVHDEGGADDMEVGIIVDDFDAVGGREVSDRAGGCLDDFQWQAGIVVRLGGVDAQIACGAAMVEGGCRDGWRGGRWDGGCGGCRGGGCGGE